MPSRRLTRNPPHPVHDIMRSHAGGLIEDEKSVHSLTIGGRQMLLTAFPLRESTPAILLNQKCDGCSEAPRSIGLKTRSQWLGNELVGLCREENRGCPNSNNGPACDRAVIPTER